MSPIKSQPDKYCKWQQDRKQGKAALQCIREMSPIKSQPDKHCKWPQDRKQGKAVSAGYRDESHQEAALFKPPKALSRLEEAKDGLALQCIREMSPIKSQPCSNHAKPSPASKKPKIVLPPSRWQE